MQAAPARYVSVSELYSTDEVELLLDEIRELEPTSCRGEDVQDLEIAGSGCGAGGRSPAGSGTEGTERSWDSHAHYSRVPPPRPRPLAPLYCGVALLREPRHAAALLLLVTCSATCMALWAAGRVAARAARELHLAALSSLLAHAALLFVRLTRLDLIMPLHWDGIGAAGGLWSAVSLTGGGALALHRVLPAGGAPLLAAAGLGLTGAGVALVAATLLWRAGREGGEGGAGGAGGVSLRAAYRAVPTAPPPSTSRDDPL